MKTIILGCAVMAAVIAAPATATMKGSEMNAMLAAGCAIRHYPNPTNKLLVPAPTVQCSPQARAAFEQSRQSNAVARRADTDTQRARRMD